MNKKKLLFVYTRLSTFVKGDMDILEQNFQIKILHTDNSSQMKQFVAMLHQFLYLLLNIWKFDLVYIWFADYHSFLPILFARLTGKKSFLVIGGYDVCRIRKVNYGSFVNPIRGYMTRYSMSNATRCLCVSEHIQRTVRFITQKSKTTVVYNCVTLDGSGQTEKSGILSVSIASSPQGIYVKGVDRIVALARELPDQKITLIGANRDALFSICGALPENLTIIPRISHEKLKAYYIKAKVYCQLSRSESFAVSLAEAMYNDCIPVISNTGGMPEVGGKLAFIADGNNIKECAAAVREALLQPFSNKYREHIQQNFSKEKRAAAIIKILENS